MTRSDKEFFDRALSYTPETFMPALIARIRKADTSQYRLSEVAGFPPQHLTRWKSLDPKPSLESMLRLDRAMREIEAGDVPARHKNSPRKRQAI